MNEAASSLCFFCQRPIEWQDLTGFWCQRKRKSPHPGEEQICEQDAHSCHREYLMDQNLDNT